MEGQGQGLWKWASRLDERQRCLRPHSTTAVPVARASRSDSNLLNSQGIDCRPRSHVSYSSTHWPCWLRGLTGIGVHENLEAQVWNHWATENQTHEVTQRVGGWLGVWCHWPVVRQLLFLLILNLGRILYSKSFFSPPPPTVWYAN